ncbi:MAG: glycosyltransferase, partial [Methanobacteriota archaeon]
MANLYRESVTIIVPLLNEEANIKSQIRHFRSLPVNEVFFVDGGSLDSTRDILKSSGTQWITSSRGRAVQLNAGATLARSNILLFVHADTFLYSWHIEEIRRTMRDPRVVGGRFDIRLSGRHPAFRVIEFFINLRSRLT